MRLGLEPKSKFPLLSIVCSEYDAALRQLLILSRTEDPATAAPVFVDRDTDTEESDQGYA
jgi:hypothetical protein